MRHFTRLPVRWVPVALVARPFMRTVGTLKCRNETISGFFPTVGTCCQTGPREVTFPLAPGTVVDVRTPLAICQTEPREVTFPLRPGTVAFTMCGIQCVASLRRAVSCVLRAKVPPAPVPSSLVAPGWPVEATASAVPVSGKPLDPRRTSTVAQVARPRGGGTFATWQWSKPKMVMMMGTATAWKTLGKQ